METRTNTRLDSQESQIKQLQSDVAEIRSSLTHIEADRAESAEFRKVVLSWMRQFEKKPSDSSGSGSGVSGMEFSSSGSPHASTVTPSGLPWAVKKVKLPEFFGFDPQGWIQKASQYFDINNTPDELRLRLAKLSMVGVAQHWFTVITFVHDSLTWSEFETELMQRFSGLEIQNPYEELATIKQSSIHDYIEDFEYLLSLVPRLPESQAMGYFVAGLKDDVKKWVRLHRPQSRLDAMHLAKNAEEMLRPGSGTGSISRFRYAPRVGPYPNGLSDGSNLWGRLSPSWVTLFLNRIAPRPSDLIRPDLLPLLPNLRGVRSLSRSEWDDRRKKGLCFRCGQQYGPAHKCPEGKLRVILLGDDEYDLEDGENMMLASQDASEVLKTDGLPTGTCLALEFPGLMCDSGGAKTLRFEGILQEIPVSILVDSGATHNFISRRVAITLGLPMFTFAGIRIKLGDGHHVFVTEMCHRVSVQINSCTFVVDALVFDTDCLDLILGMAWLGTLGEVIHDWHMAWMQFQFNSQTVRLQGLHSGQSSPPALQQWLSQTDVLPTSSVSNSLIDSSFPLHNSLTVDQQHSILSILEQFAAIFLAPTALNNATTPDKLPIPVVDELLDELHGARFFSKLDLKSGYNQIRMREDSIEKTAFRTHDGHYEYLVMPFGLTNAPATFQAVMNNVFRPFLRRSVVIFFDDILVYSPTWESHLQDLHSVFSILLQHQFKVNKRKCSFGQVAMEYLGHVIDGQGVSMDPKKIDAVMDWPAPKTIKGLQGFFGLTGYYRKFVKNYGSIARPLTELTKKRCFFLEF
ncbi:uncharacterized protein LOC143582177 [Bidens hawaiensis]|uniref:uncharacterized protein LOC143582177 n=1 Tax=Bidens hawaiensis TaxID=980011 RepID=UPI00404AE240